MSALKTEFQETNSTAVTTAKPELPHGNQTKQGIRRIFNEHPVGARAAALLLQANPKMTPDQVKARLMLDAYKTFPTSSIATDPTTGMSYMSYYDIFTVGAGYLDIAAALADTRTGSISIASAITP